MPKRPDDLRRFDAVHAAFESDVHKDQVRLQPLRLANRSRTRRRHRNVSATELLEAAHDVERDDAVVLNDKKSQLSVTCSRHDAHLPPDPARTPEPVPVMSGEIWL